MFDLDNAESESWIAARQVVVACILQTASRRRRKRQYIDPFFERGGCHDDVNLFSALVRHSIIARAKDPV